MTMDWRSLLTGASFLGSALGLLCSVPLAHGQAVKNADGYYQDSELLPAGAQCGKPRLGLFGGRTNCAPPCYTAPPCYSTPMVPSDPTDPMQTTPQDMGPAPEIDTTAIASSFGAAQGNEGSPNMIGDFLGASHGSSSQGGIAVNTTRTFKAMEFQSSHVQNRNYFLFNYWNDVGGDPGGGGAGTQIMRFTPGFERTIMDGGASFGMRVPLNYVDPGVPFGGMGTSFGSGNVERAAFGNLTGIFKYALMPNNAYGDAATIGLALQLPTGSSTFAGVPNLATPSTVTNNGSIQPFVGGLRLQCVGCSV